jgi:hypothetical protein
MAGVSPNVWGNETKMILVAPLIHEGRRCLANEFDPVQYSGVDWACAGLACLWRFALQGGRVKHQDNSAVYWLLGISVQKTWKGTSMQELNHHLSGE